MPTDVAGQGGSNATDPIVQAWERRREKILSQISDDMAYYAWVTEYARYGHRFLSIVVMVCSVLAPIAVVSSGADDKSLTVFGLSHDAVKVVSLMITIFLAVAEGLKRIFRFDQRWATCYMAREALRRARDNFRIANIGVPVGTDPWQANFRELLRVHHEVTDKESNEFFDSVKADFSSTLDPARGRRP